MPREPREALLIEHGLYDPATEHDACGVGLIAALDGKPRREVVELGIAALKAVWHRGAVDADGKTGDGAGLNIQIPRAFFEDYIGRIGRPIEARQLAVGMIFLPKKNLSAQEECRSIVESEVLRAGFTIYGWRQVPVDPQVIGEVASEKRPEIEQILLACPKDLSEPECERLLYCVRRKIEHEVLSSRIPDFYICSFSCRSLIYKGLFKAEQLTAFYPDLLDPRFISNFAIFHQRFSTNTAPAWHLAQPFRILAHNGEINTLKGNINWMKSHEANMHYDGFGEYLPYMKPVLTPGLSDTGMLDAAMEIHVRADKALPLAKLILTPPAWSMNEMLSDRQKAMFAYCNCISEQWDGPAAIAATDGEWVIAGLDRGGLRPMRYAITDSGLLLVGSESGMVPFEDAEVKEKGRLGPGDIIGVHLGQGKFYRDKHLKDMLAGLYPFGEWVKNIRHLDDLLPEKSAEGKAMDETELRRKQLAVGWTMEEVELILAPMADTAKEAVGSMGDDTPLAVFSDKPRGFHHFFRQNFSQVTNPPIDSLRERRVMSLFTRFGNSGNMLTMDESHGRSLLLHSPVLLSHELEALAKYFQGKTATLESLFEAGEEGAMERRLRALCDEAEAKVRSGTPYLILTDEAMSATLAPIPMILLASAVHVRLVKAGLRKAASIIVRSSECVDVHYLAILIGVGVTAVNSWLAEETISFRQAKGLMGAVPRAKALANFKEAMNQGLLKIMSKMGISVVGSYRGGCNFEALGLSRALVSEFFPGVPSRISGIGFEGIEQRVLKEHAKAYQNSDPLLSAGGFYRYRAGGEAHGFAGNLVHLLQSAVGKGAYRLYKQYSDAVRAGPPVNLRDLLDFQYKNPPISVEQVEPVTEIRKRFIAPAMSHGALSREAHETLAIAMNRMGAGSNSGEGGEDPERYKPRANGDNANSPIKQVASARFGVTAEYLNSARELQIKVAQGAKPGEGGQLPGFKVTEEIARLRHATPGVSLISPPPHHDIYSIEDLAQLIYDLKQINPSAHVSVKLVAQAGIGTIASGVAKAMADKILIAGHNGGTGASPYSSIKFAGIPWEMGLAEANQVLTLNRLRHRVVLQTDGGIKTGRDVVIAAMLGAEEFGVGTASLVAMGCILVRQCHSNTCPVGICTQDPKLREKFEGSVEKVIHLFSFIAEEVREILASLGVAKLEDVIGRTDLLTQVSRGSEDLVDLDLNPLLVQADPGLNARYCTLQGRNEVPPALDEELLSDVKRALTTGEKIQRTYTVRNIHRTVGTRISSLMVKSKPKQPLQEDQLTLNLRGSAGQSLGAFAVHGVRIEVLGDANDYVGKGLSGGTIILRPKPSAKFVASENTIIGNTVLYGATAGRLFAAGQAGERFAVRNSGAVAVIEGCGSNGCEYMTGGTAVILGPVGDNFAAGMTGGMAFVYDPEDLLRYRLNGDSVECVPIGHPHWEAVLKTLIEEHARFTESRIAQNLLGAWEWEVGRFRQICPKEMVCRLEMPLNMESQAASTPVSLK